MSDHSTHTAQNTLHRTARPEAMPSLPLLAQVMHPSAARVYRLVWHYCQHDGGCRITLRTLGHSAGLCASDVLYHLRALVRDGYLEDLGAENARRPHRYALTARRLAAAERPADESGEGEPR